MSHLFVLPDLLLSLTVGFTLSFTHPDKTPLPQQGALTPSSSAPSPQTIEHLFPTRDLNRPTLTSTPTLCANSAAFWSNLCLLFPQEVSDTVAAVKTDLESAAKSLNDGLKETIKRGREILERIETAANKVSKLYDGFVKQISGDMSYSKEKTYTVGLLKGWRATLYSRATLDGQLLPNPTAEGKVSVGINYATTTPKRQGGILDISLEPSVKLKQSDGLNGNTDYNIEFEPPIKDLVPMMRSSTWVVIGVCIRVCMREG